MNDKHPTLAEQIAERCRHYNGIYNKTCGANMRYSDVKGDGNGLATYPCFKSSNCAERCFSASFLSEQEVADEVKRSKAATVAFLAELAEGKTCPHCHTPIEKRYQVGRCVYAKPCGCRQYQGTVPKDERTPKDQREIEEQSSLWGGFEEEE